GRETTHRQTVRLERPLDLSGGQQGQKARAAPAGLLGRDLPLRDVPAVEHPVPHPAGIELLVREGGHLQEITQRQAAVSDPVLTPAPEVSSRDLLQLVPEVA